MAPVCREDYPFMTCILKVDGSSGLKTVAKVLGKCQGVNSFQMDDNGLVEVSGTVDPESLLKVLGKAGNKAEIRWFQFGQCSNNLFMRTNNGSGCGGDYNNGRYLHSGNVARPTLPSYDDAVGYYNGRNNDYRITYNGHNHDYQLANYDQSYGHGQVYYGHGHGY